MFGLPLAVNHIAITLPDRESWMKQLAFLQKQGVKFERRVNHGMTRSLYISDPNGYGVELLYELPRDMWEGDIDAALNWAENLPTEGEAALVDEIDEPDLLGEQMKGADTAIADGVNAVGNLVVNVGGGEDGPIATDRFGLIEAALNSALVSAEAIS